MESNRWQPKMHSGFDTMHLTRAQKLTGSQKITEKYKKCEANCGTQQIESDSTSTKAVLAKNSFIREKDLWNKWALSKK